MVCSAAGLDAKTRECLAPEELAGTVDVPDTKPEEDPVRQPVEAGVDRADERIRPPMRWDASGPGAGFTTGTPWEAFGDDPPGTDVATQSADPESLLSTYRDLIALRAANPALRGEVENQPRTVEHLLDAGEFHR